MKISTLYAFAVGAIFIVPYKVYPLLFIIFSVSILLLDNKKNSWMPFPIVGIYFFYVLICSSSIDLHYLSIYKFIVNFIFLITSLIYLRNMLQTEEKLFFSSLKLTIQTVAIINFVQVLISVSIGGLWLHPFQLENSEDAYAIQNIVPIIFGDENKNIWASKYLILYLSCLYLQKVGCFSIPMLTHALTLIIVIYTSSRTAQLALFFAYAILFYDLFVVRFRRLIYYISAISGCFFIICYVIPFVINYDISAGHGGDGLFARFILWHHLLEITANMSALDFYLGHGISAAEIYLPNYFQENNWHNVLLNQFYAFGIVGVSLYVLFVSRIFMKSINAYVIGLPLLLISMSQYSGYEPELVICYALITLGGKCINTHA